MSKVDRRRFLKHIGAGVALVGAATVGYYLYDKGLARRTGVAVPTITQTGTTVDYPPYADFKYKPCYLNPTDQQTIQFTNMSYDLGGDPLKYRWLIDNQPVSEEKDYATKLPVGQHLVGLDVSDGRHEVAVNRAISVDLDLTATYPVRPLQLRYKGVRYFAGSIALDWPNIPTPNNEEMDEQLDTIRSELDCNAISVCGGEPSEDRMIECATMAIDKGFERIYVQPSYNNATVDETIDKIGKFAPKVKSLRERSHAVVYMVGHEFPLETAIIPGETQMERWKNWDNGQGWNKVRAVLPRIFKRIIDVCKVNYGYPISYAATPPEAYEELVPWSDPAFESVGVDAYVDDAHGLDDNWIFRLLERLKRFRKPIHCADFGMMSYSGADKFGAGAPLYAYQHGYDQPPYDEDPQVRFTKRTLDILNRARIDGCFWVQYNDNFDKGHGLYHPQTRKRKKGFYMYKNYQRSP